MAQIDLNGVGHCYSGKPEKPTDFAIQPMSHVWEDGCAYALLGPSGCGKTTLLNIISGLILSVLQVGIMLFIMSLIIFNTEVSLALGGVKTTLHLNILAFGILHTPISKITGLFMNVFSRKNEFEADAYATETFDGGALQTALKKLSVENLSNLLPHPWYVFFHYSHPPLMQRLEAIETHKGQSLKIGEPI